MKQPASASGLVTLHFDGHAYRLPIGLPLDDALSTLGGLTRTTWDDPAMRRTYLTIEGHGIQLLFQDQRLDTIFLTLAEDETSSSGTFGGHTDLLSREVLASRDEGVFSRALLDQGFEAQPWTRTTPPVLDMLSDSLRLRLTTSGKKVRVMIDNGIRVRKPLP